MVDFDLLLEKSKKHLRPEELYLSYGTAGFRSLASQLDHIFFRVGILATLRSKYKNAVIGVMTTASHNPVQDNGVKIIDPAGEMMEESWEKFASKLGNAKNDEIVDVLKDIIKQCDIDLSIPANIYIGMDTRPSSKSLCESLKDGISAIGGCFKDLNLLTTPQLHYIVNRQNQSSTNASESGYYDEFCDAFIETVKDEDLNNVAKISVDCANGVGALKLKFVADKLAKYLPISLVNDGSGELNKNCGADFVKMQQKPPMGQEPFTNGHFVSYDGDADRIMYYTLDDKNNFQLLDGDKMASLIALYLKNSLSSLGINVNIGVIQTAYANGSSTDFLTNSLKVNVACTKTGVKHLHAKAKEFDIGIYFEPNGHGTVLIKDCVLTKLDKASEESSSAKQAQKVKSVVKIINQTVGDSMTDMLLFEAILILKKWSLSDWCSMYTELPNRQLKVKVNDRNAIITTNQEREVEKPDGLQAKINEIVKEFPSGRSFVRPSGTEDVVRVYAESTTQENADNLAKKISDAVKQFL